MKKAIEKGNIEGARIYAQNAIRKKSEQLNFLKLGSRLDAVVSRLETQAKMSVINKSFAGIVKTLERALNNNNLEQAGARRPGGPWRAGGGSRARRPVRCGAGVADNGPV